MNKTLFIWIGITILLMPVFLSAQEMVDINTATLEQLDTLIGIGPVYAQRIIDARPFSSIDDLIRVNGIGEKTLQKIKDQGLAYVERTETETSETTPPNIVEEVETPVSYPEGVIINKIMPSPEGADADNEYIELKNTNNFEVDLSSWILRDKQGSIKEYVLEEKIAASESLTLLRTKTKITLNNQGDGVELLNPLKEIVDSVDFGKAEVGIAYIKTSSGSPRGEAGWQWDFPENPQAPRSASLQPQQEEPQKIPLQAQIKEAVEINLSNEPAKHNISIYLTGVFVALVSSLIFLIIKRRVLF